MGYYHPQYEKGSIITEVIINQQRCPAAAAQVIKLTEVIKDKSGKVTKLKCSRTPGRPGRREMAVLKMKDDAPEPDIQMILMYNN